MSRGSLDLAGEHLPAYQALRLPGGQGRDTPPVQPTSSSTRGVHLAGALLLSGRQGDTPRAPRGWQSLVLPHRVIRVANPRPVHSRTLFFVFCCSIPSRSSAASLSKDESWSVFSCSLE